MTRAAAIPSLPHLPDSNQQSNTSDVRFSMPLPLREGIWILSTL